MTKNKMMICPKASDCSNTSPSLGECYHAKEHELSESCNLHSEEYCPICVEVKK